MTGCFTTIPRRGAADRHGGFIVVVALWILTALATLASIASIYVAQSATALTANDVAVQTETLVTAGLSLAAYQLSASAGGAKKPTRGGFVFRLGGSVVTLEYRSEAARLNLNMAPKAFIAGLFAVLGAPPQAADHYAERVVRWRTPPKADSTDDEDELYRAASLRYFPRRAPFSHLGELWLVAGLPRALVERALPHVTIFSGMPGVNVLDASAEVVAALPGMTPARLNSFLSTRESLPPDPQFIVGALGDMLPGATVEGSNAYQVRMRIALPNGAEKTSEVVIMCGGAEEPYRVLSWQDDIDTGTGAPRSTAETR